MDVRPLDGGGKGLKGGTESKRIRLVKLEKSESAYDLIQCSLIEVDLDAGTSPYIVHEPLDTVDTEKDHVILCNETFVNVSEYTYFFLRMVRQREDERFQLIWSPRLCLDSPDSDQTSEELISLIEKKMVERVSVGPTYRYTPLTNPDCIRLVEIDSPPNLHGVLRVKIREVSLTENPEFVYLDIRTELMEASWPHKQPILCNSRFLSIACPSYQILSSILTAHPYSFYVQAVSVDPKNDEEKKDLGTPKDEEIREKAMGTATMEHPKVVYEPLPDSQTHIRLLQMASAPDWDNVLVADIGYFPLDSAPEFVALSYVWGQSAPQDFLCMRNGAYIPCTQSLRNALRNLRQRGDLVVWADAICINQEDDAEKSKQVMMMGEIYKRASRVIVELGRSHAGTKDRTREFLPPLIKMLSLTGQTLQAVRPESPILDPSEYSAFGIPKLTHSAWASWRAMRSAPWLTRSWIVQEIATGKEVTVMYNGIAYDWKDLAIANQVTATEQVDIGVDIGRTNMTNLNDLKQVLGRNPPKLFDLLKTFRGLDAVDPRDKIYAFHGLAADRDDLPLVDYSRSLEQTYLEYATYFIKQGRELDLLINAGLSRSTRSIPSWVQDWSFTNSSQIFNFSTESGSTYPKAQEQTGSLPTAQISISQDHEASIVVAGAILDEVVSVSFPVSNTSRYNASHGHARRIDLEIIHLYARAKTMIPPSTETSNEQHLSNVQRTLLGGSATSFEPFDGYFASSKMLGNGEESEGQNTAVDKFEETLRERLSRRRLGLTKEGRLCLLPAVSDKHDFIVWFKGAEALMVVRKKGDGFVLIGDTFINGLSERGEAGVPSIGLTYEELLLF